MQAAASHNYPVLLELPTRREWLLTVLQAGGVLLMAPEHKNSLYLKHLEMSLAAESTSQQSCAAQVLDLLNNFPYFDILDESDEVLHHQ